MSAFAEQLSHAREVRQRLRNPANAVRDDGIDLKRAQIIPIIQAPPVAETVPVTVTPKLISSEGMTVLEIDTAIRGLQEQVTDLRKQRFELVGLYLSVKTVQEAVCTYFRITQIDLLSERRTKDIVYPRQLSMYLCKTLTLRSYPEIGRRTGGRDHTTAVHAVKKIERRLLVEPQIEVDIRALRELLGA